MKEKARRYNKGKNRYILFPPFAKQCVIDVYTRGAHKYSIYKDAEGNLIKGMDIPFEQRSKYQLIEDASDNWRKGLSWMETLDSVQRHHEALVSGEDIDPELQTYHAANAAWGYLTLLEFYKIYPQGDDRKHNYLQPKKIGLDIDEVICDFVTGWHKTWDADCAPECWNYDWDMSDRFKLLTEREELVSFYMNLQPKINPKDIPFEPACYVTSRPIPSENTAEWLKKHKFPKAKVITVPINESKVEVIKSTGIDIFVDDKYENFVELNNAGICTFLFDAPHNRRYDVGYKRIKSLKELV